MTLKDLFDVSGELTLAGSKALDDLPPATCDAPIGSRLRTELIAESALGIRSEQPSLFEEVRTGLFPGGRWIRTSSSGASGEADAILPVKDRPR
jgi:aspartyl-tRNA(Asn)/glutamyl-tRNA(Gln) amidotransferase subunit A